MQFPVNETSHDRWRAITHRAPMVVVFVPAKEEKVSGPDEAPFWSLGSTARTVLCRGCQGRGEESCGPSHRRRTECGRSSYTLLPSADRCRRATDPESY